MRTGLFFGALLATALFGGTALADRSSDTDNKSDRGKSIKEQVLDKQKESHSKVVRQEARGAVKQDKAVKQHLRPKGDTYGDQAQRSASKTSASAAGRNMSSSNAINTPSEIRQMKHMINPMLGAYRTSQAAEGTDSYGGNESSRVSMKGGERSRNLSATNAVNTPSEIKHMIQMINPMHGAYRTSQASEGTDSYGGSKSYVPWSASKGTTSVHFKNDKGEVIGVAKGDNKAAEKNEKVREKMSKMIKDKLAKTSSK